LVGTGVEGDKGPGNFDDYVNENRFPRFTKTIRFFFLNEVLTTGSPFRYIKLESLLADEGKL
jgi:hypothetical protein